MNEDVIDRDKTRELRSTSAAYDKACGSDPVLASIKELAVSTALEWKWIMDAAPGFREREAAEAATHPDRMLLSVRLAWAWIVLPVVGRELFTPEGPTADLEQQMASHPSRAVRDHARAALRLWRGPMDKKTALDSPFARGTRGDLCKLIVGEWAYFFVLGQDFVIVDAEIERELKLPVGTMLVLSTGVLKAALLGPSEGGTGPKIRDFFLDVAACGARAG